MTLKIDNDTCWIMTFIINVCTLHSAVGTTATTTNTQTSSGSVSAKLSLQKYAFHGGITWTSSPDIHTKQHVKSTSQPIFTTENRT